LKIERVLPNVRFFFINIWANLAIFYFFATKQRFLLSVQLLGNNELFHQSSIYLKNIVLSFQLLFQQRYMHFSPGKKSGGKCPGECPRPKIKPATRWA